MQQVGIKNLCTSLSSIFHLVFKSSKNKLYGYCLNFTREVPNQSTHNSSKDLTKCVQTASSFWHWQFTKHCSIPHMIRLSLRQRLPSPETAYAFPYVSNATLVSIICFTYFKVSLKTAAFSKNKFHLILLKVFKRRVDWALIQYADRLSLSEMRCV